MLLSDTPNSPIAKEKLSAYQRWELTSFENENGLDAESTKANSKELDDLKAVAQKDGFAKGFEEGYQAGLKNGQEEGQKALQQELDVIKQIGTEFSSSVQQAEQLLARDVLDLALDLAKVMIKSALSINPELIIPIVQEAIASLPSVQQPAQLCLHPTDAALVKQRIGDTLAGAGWVVEADAELQPGDCRIETQKNQINATSQARWKQLTDALGRDNKWLDGSS